jgi:hypothetical protein
VRGRGIVDGSHWDGWRGVNAKVPIDFRHCKNVYAEGLIFHNSNSWVFNAFETDGALIENIKIISARPNGDGFTYQSCRNIETRNSFARTWDDTLVIKNYEGNTDNILFKDMVLWTDLAQSMEIGFETNKGNQPDARITNITFENITVINALHKPVMSIHNSDDATVRNVFFRNIVVENAAMGGGDAADNRQLIDITIAASGWSTTRNRGKVYDVFFENINVLDATQPQTFRITGHDDEHYVQGVSIKNLTLMGENITSLDQLDLTSRFASGITLEAGPGPGEGSKAPPIAGVPETTVTWVRTPEQDAPITPPEFILPDMEAFILPDGENLAQGKRAEVSGFADVYNGRMATDGRDNSYWEGDSFPSWIIVNLNDEVTVSQIAVQVPPFRAWGPRTQEIAVSVSLDGEEFTEIVPETAYHFDPQTGNGVLIRFDAVPARFVRVEVTSNTGATGGQIAELSIFE